MSIEFIRAASKDQGVEAALEIALASLRQMETARDAMWKSRFFEMRILDDGAKKLWPVTETQISRSIDLQDCDPDVPDFFYCDADGQLHQVSVGTMTRHGADPDSPDETPFRYASAPLLANGQAVGTVIYTDH